ncbi:MAG: response regulator transcription factor [bacterium]
MSNLAYKMDQSPESKPQPYVLVVEDDPDLQSILSFHLQKEGYRVRCLSKAEDLLRLFETNPEQVPHGIVVDINLAGHLNGYELTQMLRAQRKTSSIPILMLTAKTENNDVVRGLNEGADDYLPKPFDMGVFMARMKAVIRRAERFPYPVSSQKEKIAMCGIELDPTTHQATIENNSVHLTVTEFGLLRSLMTRPNEVWSRDDLLMRVSGPTKMVTGRTIDVHVRSLREKLGDKAKHIMTVRGVGYKFSP